MKTIIIPVIMLVLSVASAAHGQSLNDLDPNAAIPLDTNVRCGRLKNGFTYYIRRNTWPSKKVSMNLVVKAGSMQEDSDQRGLAHVLEHTAFQGTTHFPEGIFKYLDQFGIERGKDINASTRLNSTVYQLEIPSDDDQLLHRALQCLRDWCSEFLLDSQKIEIERGAVLAEMREGRQGARDGIVARLLGKSGYGRRAGEDNEENIRNFKHSSLIRFYKDWYRPDLQAAVIVGDIDVDRMERKISAMFADLFVAPAARQRMEYPAFTVEKQKCIVVYDPGILDVAITLHMKMRGGERKTKNDYKRSLIASLYDAMMRERLYDIQSRYLAPVNLCRSYVKQNGIDGSFSAHGLIGLNVLTTVIKVDSIQNIEAGFKAVFQELVRAKKYGFSGRELNLAKQKIRQNEFTPERIHSREFINDYVDHFEHGAAVIDPAVQNRLMKELIESLSLQEINGTISQWINDTLPDIVIEGPENIKHFLPDNQSVSRWMNEVRSSSIGPYQPYSEMTLPDPVQDGGGEPISVSMRVDAGITEYLFASGLKIILKPNKDGSSDDLFLHGFRGGGAQSYPAEDRPSVVNAPRIIMHSGAGNLNKFQLDKLLSGKSLKVHPYISEEWTGIRARADKSDLQLMMQLVHLYIAFPVRDTIAFRDWDYLERKAIKRRDPRLDFLNAIRTETGEARQVNGFDDLSMINFDEAHRAYRTLFGDIGSFTFILTGDFRPADVMPILTKYLASLPSNGSATISDKIPDGFHVQGKSLMKTKYFYTGTEKNKAEVQLRFTGPLAPGMENTVKLSVLLASIRPILSDIFREEVYAVFTNVSYIRNPRRYVIAISFRCPVDQQATITQRMLDVMASFGDMDIDRSLEGIVIAERRTTASNLKQNMFWTDYLTEQYQNNQDPAMIFKRMECIEALTPGQIKSAAAEYLNPKHCTAYVLLHEDEARSEGSDK